MSDIYKASPEIAISLQPIALDEGVIIKMAENIRIVTTRNQIKLAY